MFKPPSTLESAVRSMNDTADFWLFALLTLSAEVASFFSKSEALVKAAHPRARRPSVLVRPGTRPKSSPTPQSLPCVSEAWASCFRVHCLISDTCRQCHRQSIKLRHRTTLNCKRDSAFLSIQGVS